jgi:2-methylisocitrate lyase-like PEP mutase family enzyme
MNTTLRERLEAPDLVLAPGVHDMVSLRLADRMGFEAVYMTGFGTVASHLGLPDAGLATYRDMLNRVQAMASMAATPLIADGDTGYGGLLNVRHTVQGYEAAGAQAIQLEDQEFPKKCGHTPGRRVIPLDDMVRKIRVAVEARRSADFLIIARTDARTALGLDEALKRAQAYADAGADILFVESPESVQEMRRITAALDKPLLANMVEGGRTPVLSPRELQDIGYRLAIFPVSSLLAAAQAMRDTYTRLRTLSASAPSGPEAGAVRGLAQSAGALASGPALMPFSEMTELMGFNDVWDFERRHAHD